MSASAWHAKRRDLKRTGVLPAPAVHGTPNAYTNYGCRCESCRVAHSYYRSQRRALNPEKHTTYMREYMREYRAGKRTPRMIAETTKQPYACRDCDLRFTAIDRLATHRAVAHPQTQLTDDEVFGRFERARWIGEATE